MNSIKTSSSRPYPTVGDLVALLAVYIAATVAFGLIQGLCVRIHVMDEGSASTLAYVASFAVAIAFGLSMERMRTGVRPRVFRHALRRCDPSLVLWGVVVVFALTVAIEPLLALFPSAWLEWISNRMGSLGGWMMLTSVVLAPLMEETLFRGVIQRPLVGRLGPVRGILLGALIFGAVHGIPQQVVNAFAVGVVLGYLYYKSGSLLPVIIIHGVNNATAYFSWVLSGEQITSMREVLEPRAYAVLYAASCAVCLFAFGAMVRTFVRDARRRKVAAVESKTVTDGATQDPSDNRSEAVVEAVDATPADESFTKD